MMINHLLPLIDSQDAIFLDKQPKEI